MPTAQNNLRRRGGLKRLDVVEDASPGASGPADPCPEVSCVSCLGLLGVTPDLGTADVVKREDLVLD